MCYLIVHVCIAGLVWCSAKDESSKVKLFDFRAVLFNVVELEKP